MLSRTALIPFVLVGALVAATPASAAGIDRPVAHAAADDEAPALPSLVQTRITRVENAVDRLTEYVDDGDAAGVDRTGKVIRRQLAAAWRGAKYYVKNQPPVVEEGEEPEDAAVADAYTTAQAVFTTQHNVAANIAQLVDGARVPVLDAMSKTLFWTLDARDKAITEARALDVPPTPTDPEEEPEGEAAGFATVMPLVSPLLDDEIQQINGLQADATDLRPGGKKVLRSALVQTVLAKNTINTYWPAVEEG